MFLKAMIFVSHRRVDTAPQTQGLVAALRQHGWPVFLDVESIDPGQSIRSKIDAAIDFTAILLVLIGKSWRCDPGSSSSKLDDPYDFVRLEIEWAAQRAIPLLPILVDDAKMPKLTEVPPSLVGLLDLRAMPLRHDSYSRDSEDICDAVDSVMRKRGFGDRLGKIGRHQFLRGQQVKFATYDYNLSKEETGSVPVRAGHHQVGYVLGVKGKMVLVRFPAQRWTRTVLGKSTLMSKVDVSDFDSWIYGSNLKSVA